MLIHRNDNQDLTPEELSQEELKALRKDFIFLIYSAKNILLKARSEHPELLDKITQELLQNSPETKDLSAGELLILLFNNLEKNAFGLIEGD